MDEHRAVLQGLREIRRRLQKETPQYTDEFEDYLLQQVLQDWDVQTNPVFTDAELLELETQYKRIRLRFVERSNALKVRLLEQLLGQYVEVIQKAETRHRQLLRDYEQNLREPPSAPVPDDLDPDEDPIENTPRKDNGSVNDGSSTNGAGNNKNNNNGNNANGGNKNGNNANGGNKNGNNANGGSNNKNNNGNNAS